MRHGSEKGCGLTAPCWSALAHRRSPIPRSPRDWRHSHHGRPTRDRRHAQERSVAERIRAHRCRSVPLGFLAGRRGLTHSDSHSVEPPSALPHLHPTATVEPDAAFRTSPPVMPIVNERELETGLLVPPASQANLPGPLFRISPQLAQCAMDSACDRRSDRRAPIDFEAAQDSRPGNSPAYDCRASRAYSNLPDTRITSSSKGQLRWLRVVPR